MQITGLQFEKGNIATPFDYRPLATELSLVQCDYSAMPYNVNTYPVHTTYYGSFSMYLLSTSTLTSSTTANTNHYFIPAGASTAFSKNWNTSWNASLGGMSIPYTGLYQVSFTSSFAGGGGNAQVYISTNKNQIDANANVYGYTSYNGSEGNVSCTIYLLSTDILTFGFYTGTAGMTCGTRGRITITLLSRT